MPISSCRALVVRILTQRHGTRSNPMDTQFYISILREQSEHISKLATEMSDSLEKLKQAPLSLPDAGSGGEKIKELNDTLFSLADIFHKRLHVFLTAPPVKKRFL